MFIVLCMCLLLMVCVCSSTTLQKILLIFDFNICRVCFVEEALDTFIVYTFLARQEKMFHKVTCLLIQFLTLLLTLLILRCNVNIAMLFFDLSFCLHFVFKAKCGPVFKGKP